MGKMELDLSTVEPLVTFGDDSQPLNNTASFILFFSLENECEYMWLNSEIKILHKYCDFYTYLISKLNIVLVITLSPFHFWHIK